MPATACTLRRLLTLALAGVCVASACARKGLPPGGPRDEEPPEVVATVPDSGAVRVALDAPLEIEFSESMTRTSVVDWVLLSPPRDFGERSWSGNRFRLSGGEDLRPHTTYTVVVGTGCRDARERNPMTAPYTFVFATGDSIDQGRIEGRLLAKGQPAHGTMVWAIDVDLAATRPDTVLPDYIAQAAADSTYVLLGLRPGRHYRVAAHYDANRDREFDAATEFLADYPDTLWLDPGSPHLDGIDIDYRDPEAPGTIAGTVIDSTRAALRRAAARIAAAAADSARAAAAAGDSAGAGIAAADRLAGAVAADSLATALSSADSAAAGTAAAVAPDSLLAAIVRAWPLVMAMTATPDGDSVQAVVTDTTRLATTVADTLGAFALRQLDPGYWRVEAFLDRDDDRRYDAGEPRAGPVDSVRVIPLETTDEVLLILRDVDSSDREE
ncbi:MAG: Ig-like domain-containing protein [Candidatus Eiseniibacteriota bacterium]|jgi:hypothetical protein